MSRKNEAKWVASANRWQINVQLEGRRRTFTSSIKGLKGKIAAEKKADAWLENRLIDETSTCTVLLDKYFASLQASTSAGHWKQQKNYIENYIRPVIGKKRISRVTENDFQDIIDRAYRDKGLAKKTLTNLKACCMSFVKYCRRARCSNLFIEGLTIPAGAKRSSKGILPPHDLTTLFTSDLSIYCGKRVEDPLIHAYRLAVLIGIRPGELLGLKWADIHDNRFFIKRSINDDGEITEGKNEDARRQFGLGKLAQRELAAQRELCAARSINSEWIFPNGNGEHLVQYIFRRRWRQYRAVNGLRTGITIYELRHTYVTINDEMPEGLKKKVLGHAESMDTEGVYGHLQAEDLSRAAEYSDKAMSRILGIDL